MKAFRKFVLTTIQNIITDDDTYPLLPNDEEIPIDTNDDEEENDYDQVLDNLIHTHPRIKSDNEDERYTYLNGDNINCNQKFSCSDMGLALYEPVNTDAEKIIINITWIMDKLYPPPKRGSIVDDCVITEFPYVLTGPPNKFVYNIQVKRGFTVDYYPLLYWNVMSDPQNYFQLIDSDYNTQYEFTSNTNRIFRCLPYDFSRVFVNGIDDIFECEMDGVVVVVKFCYKLVLLYYLILLSKVDKLVKKQFGQAIKKSLYNDKINNSYITADTVVLPKNLYTILTDLSKQYQEPFNLTIVSHLLTDFQVPVTITWKYIE